MMVDRPFFALQRASLARAALCLVLGSVGLACVERSDDLGATGSETHFLLECSETCAAGLDCVAGVCTSACASDEGCAIWSSAAVCSAEPGAVEPGVCDVQCSVAADCASLGAGYRCAAGACRSAALASTEPAPGSLPSFEVLELRRLLDDAPAGGSNCDPRELSAAYFVDLPARQVSWVSCADDARNRIYLSSTGQWPLADGDRADLLAAFARLRVGDSELCYESGGGFLDVTTADSARFSYGDDALGKCPVRQLGRTPVINLSNFYSALATIVSDRPRGLPRDESTGP